MATKIDKTKEAPVTVTRPWLPPLEEFIPYLERIWRSRWLTNIGPLHQEFESALAEYLGVQHLSLISSGTIALMIAFQTLGLTGEVITTPYSFVATAHSLLWSSLRPVFVDIDPRTMNLDADKIEAAITPQTSAILPVHCYGNPCDVQAIQKVADAHGLKVIYDGAHAFGVQLNGQSLLKHGDLSILSLHATKVFTSAEGGAIVCRDARTKCRIDLLRNFGFVDEVTVAASGINGKMNELQAAFGMLQLKYVEDAIEKRRTIDERYRSYLYDVQGIEIPPEPMNSSRNYGYFPILITPGYLLTRDGLFQRLGQANIFARRYFYPLISDMPMYRGFASSRPENLQVARKMASQVICLPIFPDLARDDQDRIIEILRGEH